MTDTTRRKILAAAAALPAGLALGDDAAAQGDFPSRPVRIIVPFPPGGSNDVLARALAERLSPRIGQPVVIENRGGAGGALGADAVAKSAPDGYTLLFISSSLTTNAATQPLPYDPAKDFTAVAQVAGAPMIVVVGSDFEARTLQDLLRIARAQPNRLRFGGAGPGDTSFFSGELMKQAANIEMEPVSYRGIVAAQTDVAAGRIELVVTTLASARSLIDAGKLRVLAVAAEQRDPALPDVPTAREAGLDYVTGVWFGVFGPAGMPAPVVARLNREVNEILRDPGYQEFLSRVGATAAPLTPEAFQTKLTSEVQRWTDIARRAGVAIR
jgi:tripartite-type tricarboxylate transporter receptor subunit TctC